MADLTAMLQAAAGAGEDTDPFFNQTTLLLHGDGTNGAQNNTFLDSSSNTFTITRNGNTTQGTFSPFSLPNGEFSNYFDGSGDYLSFANGAFNLGNNDFVIESFFYILNYGGFQTIAGGNTDLATNAGASWNITILNSTGTVDATVYIGSTVYQIYVSTAVPLNAWNHIAFVRTGGRISLYLNGTRTDTLNTLSTGSVNNGSTTYPPCIAANGTGNQLEGYLSNVRIIAGATASGIYDANNTTITVPTAPLSSVANDIVLTCQSNRFVDNSGTPKTITVNGNPSVQPFSPFLPSAAYDPSVNGGSGYFDGTGDYLTLTSNAAFAFGSGDFTVEFWYYKTAEPSTTDGLVSWNYLSGVHIGENTTGIFVWVGGTNTFATSTKILLNSWSYVAVSRSGTTARLFLNGVEVSSATSTDSVSANNLFIGASSHSATEAANGYITNVRVVKGRAVYTSAFTPPTAPLGATSGGQDPPQGTETSLLCNFTNAGIFDNTGKNNLETVADAQIDTSVKKYGTGSMEFDGTTDCLFQPSNVNYGYGTGNFTIEFWLNLNATTTQTIISNASADGTVQPTIYYSNGSGIRYFTDSADRITGGALSTGQWYHIALARSGTSTKMFIDGVQTGSTYTDTNNYGASNPLIVGDYQSPPSGLSTLNGYIDDLRITKGVARYTTTFTPPTAAFFDL
jgi:hypothetical protein